MAESSRYAFLIFYFVFITILLFIAPEFGTDLVSTGDTSINAENFQPTLDPLTLLDRFAILWTISTTNLWIGIVLSALSLVAIFILIELIIDIIPL